MVEVVQSEEEQKTEATAEREETTTQFIEYLFDDEQDDDWEDEVHSFEDILLTIRTRYSGVGISRSTWRAASVMSLYLCQQAKQNGSWLH